MVVQDAGRDVAVAEAYNALEHSDRFKCIRFILEAQFGYCIKSSDTMLPVFAFQKLTFDSLLDDDKIFVLPYTLGHDGLSNEWVRFAHGLVLLQRFDLIEQLAFEKISSFQFDVLMNILPVDLASKAAARLLQKDDHPFSLPLLRALAALEDWEVTMPENFQAPLYFLRHLHEKNVEVPDGCVFAAELSIPCIFFWTYMFKKEAMEVKYLLNLILNFGNNKTKHLVRALYSATLEAGLKPAEQDMHQAIIFRLHFSSFGKQQVIRDFKEVIEQLAPISYYTVDALLDFKQYEVLKGLDYEFSSDYRLQMIIEKLHRLNDDSFSPLIEKLPCNTRRLRSIFEAWFKKTWSTHMPRLFIMPSRADIG